MLGRRTHWTFRAFCWLTTLTVAGTTLLINPANGQVIKQRNQMMEEARLRRDMPDGRTQTLTPEQVEYVEKHKEVVPQPDIRPLTAKEMHTLKGRGVYRSRYFNGTLPWQRAFRDINLSTGNLFKSFTDIQVSPAKGAGLALQRTYNANDDRIGPFGIGWTHAYDIRMEEAPGATTGDASLNYTERNDFFGGKHRYHRDADGLYSPPAYLFDELDSNYNTFLVNGPASVVDDTEHSMDGTIKHFTSIGVSRGCNYIQDRYGNTTNLVYNTVNNAAQLSTVTDPSGRQLVFTWSNLGTAQAPVYRITQVAGPAYNVSYAYDQNGNLTSSTLDPGGLNRTTSYAYTSVSDNNGVTESGLLSQITDPNGNHINYSYRIGTVPISAGSIWVSSVTEPAGVDANNNQRTQSWTVGLGALYGTGAYETYYTSGSSSTGLWMYASTDQYLRHIGYWNAPSTSYRFYTKSYDSANNVLTDRAPLFYTGSGGTIANTYTYGPHGNQLTATVNGTSETTTTSYYNASQYFQKASVTDAAGRTTSFGVGTNVDSNVGNRGSVLWVKDAKYGDGTYNNTGTRFSYTYNSNGQKTSETNENGVVTNYSYGDTWGNLTQVVQDPGTGHLNRTTSTVYDGAGRVSQSTDAMGNTTTFGYNSLGQPTQANFPAYNGYAAETVSYSYDSAGRMQNVTDARGATNMAYEAGCDRVKSVTDPVTGAITYTYTPLGQRLNMTLPGGGTFAYTYSQATANWGMAMLELLPKDDPNALSPALRSVTDDNGRRTDYSFDLPAGSVTGSEITGRPRLYLTNETYTTGANPTLVSYQQTDYTYDSVSHGRLAQIKQRYFWKDSNGNWQNKVLLQNDYNSYDAVGNRLTNQLSDVTGVLRTETYGYDQLYRLTSVDYGDGQTQSYSFDAMGNRTQKADSVSGTENYAYNNANMLLTRGSNAYTNDMAGNTLTGGGRTNTWDVQNRLRQCAYSGNTSQYTYGSDGLRRRSVINGVTTDFVLDASMFVRERQGASNVATYLVGARGPEYRRNDSTGSVSWYLFDGLGSVLGEVDPNGNITSSRKMDVYGAVRGGTNPTGTSRHKFVGSLGHPSDDESGLVYMRARHYDPITGRFVSEDKVYHGNNWFVYTLSNPIRYRDSTGLFPDGGMEESLELNLEESTQAVRSGNWMINKIERVFDIIKQETGMSRQEFRELIHQLKREMKIGAKEDLWFDTKTGNFFRQTGEGMEDLGNWMDYLP